MAPLYVLVTLVLCVGEIATLCPCPNGWTAYAESCYFYGHDGSTFFDAELYCQHRKSHLVHINDASENAFIKTYLEYLRDTKYWIGLTDQDIEDVWQWYDTDLPATYLDWNPGQPNQGSGANCAAIWGGGYHYNWVDEPCTNHFLPVCEQPCLGEGGTEIVG